MGVPGHIAPKGGNQMKGIILFVAVLLVSLGSASALNDTIVLDADTNQSVQVGFNVTLMENATLYISPESVDSRIDYEYPQEVFYDNGSVEEILFNVSVGTTFHENASVTSTFKLSNDLNNNTHIYTLTAKVHVEPKYKPFFIELVNSNYFINLSTELIPKTGSLNYDVNGLEGELLRIDCDSWLSCPRNKTFNDQGRAVFSVEYTVPVTAEIGETTRQVRLQTGNVTHRSNVTFNIFDPGLQINTYVFTEDCFVTSDDGQLTVTLECIEEKEAHDIARLTNIINRVRSNLNATCDPEIEEKLVYYGNIEEQVASELDSCRETRDVLIEDVEQFENTISSKQRALNTCQSDLQDARQDLLNNESTCLSSVFETSVRLKNDAEQYKLEALEEARSVRATTWWVVISLLMIIGSAGGFVWWMAASRKNSWVG